MDGGGGFLLDSSSALRGSETVRSTSKRAAEDSNARSNEIQSLRQVRSLTQKQEIRLMNYLDDAFLDLTRNFSKRYTAPESSSVATLDAYVAEVARIASVIASIPPVASSAPLLVSYLLRATSELCDGIQGYELAADVEERASGAHVEVAGKVESSLQQAVQVLDMFDRIWASVLRGHSVDMEAVRKHVREASSVSEKHAHVLSNVRSPSEEMTGRYTNDVQSDKSPESFQVLGSRGFATVGQTHRIRLRNVIILAKENLFAWMRTQLDAPLPPMIDGSERQGRKERMELMGTEGDVDQARESRLTDNAEEGGDGEMDEEDIALDTVHTDVKRSETRPQDNLETGDVEQKHFDDLFSRSIDPDESEEEDADHERSRKRPNKRSRSASAQIDDDHVDQKEKQNTPSVDETNVTPTEAESQATLGSTAGLTASTVMRWDVAFAHLFGRTLRCLSDLQEYSERRSEQQRGEANDDAAVLGT